jgi:hypothetical protein
MKMDKYTIDETQYKNGYRKGYEDGKKDAVKKDEECNWCEPGHEICGTCKRYFDYHGDGADECSAMFDEEQCCRYSPIDYCPKCGRKLV